MAQSQVQMFITFIDKRQKYLELTRTGNDESQVEHYKTEAAASFLRQLEKVVKMTWAERQSHGQMPKQKQRRVQDKDMD